MASGKMTTVRLSPFSLPISSLPSGDWPRQRWQAAAYSGAMMMIDSNVVFQLVVTDPDALSGTSVTAFMTAVIRLSGATVVGVCDLDGPLGELREWEGRVLPVNTFLDLTRTAVQFDWAFFFLYTQSPSTEVVSDPKAAMAEADLTIRLVDSGYFYVYGRRKSIMEDLRRMYEGAEFCSENIEALVIPF